VEEIRGRFVGAVKKIRRNETVYLIYSYLLTLKHCFNIMTVFFIVAITNRRECSPQVDWKNKIDRLLVNILKLENIFRSLIKSFII
jgi:hypothetical protein